jgi:FkbM family methyltransferase
MLSKLTSPIYMFSRLTHSIQRKANFISLNANDVCVDAGAYNGDSAKLFLDKIGNNDGYVYSFEPNADNYERSTRNLGAYKNVTVVQKGLWSFDTVLTFMPNAGDAAGSSFVLGSAAGAEYRVPVTSLDTFFKDTVDSKLPTYIKLDIEGAEKEALLGAADIIKRRKPKLAICVYHKPEDIYELPQTIIGIRNDYRFALRQHTYGYDDTVLYAI